MAFHEYPTLDQSGEPWVGSFPGLGEVLVHADGSVETRVVRDEAEDPATLGNRERTLRFGWGEPLALVRRGLMCLDGSGVVAPDAHQGCLLIVGDPADTSVVLLELAQRGWSVLADRFVPTSWTEGGLLAHPRAGPVLVPRSRSQRAGVPGREIRSHTDAVEIDMPRALTPALVGGVVRLRRRLPNERTIQQITGGDRLAAAAALPLSGVFAIPRARGSEAAEAARTLADHLRLARAPFAELRLDRGSIELAILELLRWWQTVAASAQDEGK